MIGSLRHDAWITYRVTRIEGASFARRLGPQRTDTYVQSWMSNIAVVVVLSFILSAKHRQHVSLGSAHHPPFARERAFVPCCRGGHEVQRADELRRCLVRGRLLYAPPRSGFIVARGTMLLTSSRISAVSYACAARFRQSRPHENSDCMARKPSHSV